MNQIKAFFIRKAVDKQLKSERNAQLPSLKSVKNLVVLIDHKQLPKLDDLRNFLNQKFPGAESIFLVALSKPTENNFSDEKVRLIGERDFSIFGKLKNETLKALLTQKAELLLDLSIDSSLLGNYLLASKNAGFKVGFRSDSEVHVDLMLKMPHTADEQEFLSVFWNYYLKLNGENND